MSEWVNAWLSALAARHTAALRRAELLKAIRALSARYVEGHATLHARSPLDSAGKRAAFAVFYAPLHFVTTQLVVRALGLDRLTLRRIVDLGCGTGAAGAAWARALTSPVQLYGVDASAWAAAEAAWSWRTMGVRGRVDRGDLVRAAAALSSRARHANDLGVVVGWAVSELEPAARARLLPILIGLVERGAAVLVIEPIARRLVPWWDDWRDAFLGAGGRADEWRFPIALPVALADLDEAAGFKRDELTARTLLGRVPPGT